MSEDLATMAERVDQCERNVAMLANAMQAVSAKLRDWSARQNPSPELAELRAALEFAERDAKAIVDRRSRGLIG